MRLTEKQNKLEDVTIGHRCDICGLLDKSRYGSPKGWLHFSHGHSGWGNDSIESIEYFDVCSVGCFTQQLKNSIEEMKDDKSTAEIAGMDFDFAVKLYDTLKNTV